MNDLKFIHVTKCAGTSIEDIGIKHNLLWGRFDKEYSNTNGGWHNLFTTVDPAIIDKYDWFMVVRNPYTRIESEYNWQSHPVHTTSQMNQYIIEQINNRGKPHTYNHYVEQHLYLHPSRHIHILKFENIDYEFNALMDRYNKSHIRLDLVNNRSAFKTYTVKDFSRELIDLINTVYHKDFELFHYNKIYNRPGPPPRSVPPPRPVPSTKPVPSTIAHPRRSILHPLSILHPSHSYK